MNTIENMIEREFGKDKPFVRLVIGGGEHPVLKLIEYGEIPRRLKKYCLLADSMFAHLVPMKVGIRILEEDIKEAPTEDKRNLLKELEDKFNDEYQNIYKGLKDYLRNEFWREETINKILAFGHRALYARARCVWDHELSFEEGKSPLLPNE